MWFAFRYTKVEGFRVLQVKSFSRTLILFCILFGSFATCTMYLNWESMGLNSIMKYRNGSIHLPMVLDVLFFFPIEEELLFRAFALALLLNRTKQRSNQKMLSSVTCGCLFGMFHLLNLFGGKFTVKYILFQSFVTCISGTAYSLHVLANQSILEVIFIHIMNNSLASFFPQQHAVDVLENNFALINFLGTCACQAILIYANFTKLKTF